MQFPPLGAELMRIFTNKRARMLFHLNAVYSEHIAVVPLVLCIKTQHPLCLLSLIPSQLCSTVTQTEYEGVKKITCPGYPFRFISAHNIKLDVRKRSRRISIGLEGGRKEIPIKMLGPEVILLYRLYWDWTFPEPENISTRRQRKISSAEFISAMPFFRRSTAFG